MPPRPPIRISPARFGFILTGILVVLLAIFHRDLLETIHEPELVISEIMAVDPGVYPDADGDFSGWIEIHNPQPLALEIGGWFLTDNFRKPTLWTFPTGTIPPGGFLVVFASGKNRTNHLDDLHANFRLSRKGEYLALIKPDGATVESEYLPKYPSLESGVSFGLRPRQFASSGATAMNGGPRRHSFFASPTPGRTNDVEMLGRVADTKFSHARGICTEPFDLVIRSATPGAEILYTTNGSIPRPGNGTPYSTPIPIRTTTILRAAAFKKDHRPTDVDTLTFLFPSQVPTQTGTGFPPTWGARNGEPVMADYGMDPQIADDPRYRDLLLRSLTALPILSVVMDRSDLFDPVSGIYDNPIETGSDWERPASLELLPSDGTRGFQIPGGIRIQGGWSRRPEESPKHAFRMEFKQRYGSPFLNHRLLGAGGPERMDSLVLRAGCNNSWLHWSSTERRRGELLRDEFMRESLGALGRPSSRGAFFHLYLEGLYWGIYNACERPDASFMAEHLGGRPEDYESRNAGKVLSGTEDVWNRVVELANAGLEDPARYDEFQRRVDIDGFCAFMLVQIYGGTSDWDAASNWYAGRRILPAGRYEFFIWDAERSLETVGDNILAADDDHSPTRLFQALRRNPRFRSEFAAIARRHLGPGGALSPEECVQRYSRLVDILRPAIVAESARWGDYRRDVHPYREGPYELYTVDDHWEPEVDRLLHHYFPTRTAEVTRQLRDVGLF